MSADERRAAVLRVAVGCFAAGGYAGTSTTDVAEAAGISHAYLFRLWPSKKALFLALIEHGFARVREAFAAAAEGHAGEDAMAAMGEAYGDLLRDRDQLLLQMHAYVACDDPEIGEVTRREFGRLWREVATLSGAGDEELQRFFAMGMLMNVMASMDVNGHDASWVKACTTPAWLLRDTEDATDSKDDPRNATATG
jgi:AcrR family transcriptional regulator